MPTDIDFAVVSPEVIGERITNGMKKYEISRNMMAEACHTTEQAVWYWMQGKRNPSDKLKPIVAYLLHTTVEALFYTV